MYSCNSECLTRWGLYQTFVRGQQTAANYSLTLGNLTFDKIMTVSSSSSRCRLSMLAHLAGMIPLEG